MSEPSAAGAPEARPYTPFVTDISRMARVLFSPGAVFTELRERPSPWIPLLLVSVVIAAVGIMTGPFTAKAMRLGMEASGQPVPSWVDRMPMFQAIGSPIVVLVLSAVTAGVLWVAVMALGEEAPYKKLYTIVVYSWTVAIIQYALTYVVLTMRGLDAIRTPQDAQVSLGLDNLVPADAALGGFTRALLMGISPLSIWGLVIVAVGLMVLVGTPKGKAWTAATIQFLCGLLIGAALAGMGG